MSVIMQLSAHMADLIAAGEVVERPASVVKELLENAIDAGARQVTCELQNGGMTFLRVTDNGCGMDASDAETAFLRHATSKIRDEGDLAAIGTLGFRGEALAAIASVSRIDLLTRTTTADAGVSLRLNAGEIAERDLAGCPIGTTIIVRDLFFNTPARMKFMKSDAAETAAVFAAVQKQALSHPDVSVRFIKDGQEQLSTPGDGDLHAAIYCIFGRQFALELQKTESRWEKITLSGYVTKPTATRGNRSYQNFFVNGRPIKSRLMTAALEEAYKNQMMTGRFPGCVLHLHVPPTTVDVNVHPAKTEVKFLHERDVFDAVHYGVLSALNRAPARPEVKLPATPAPAPAASTHLTVAEAARQKDFFRIMNAQEYRDLAVKTPTEKPKDAPQAMVASIVSVPRSVPYAPPPPALRGGEKPAPTTAPVPARAEIPLNVSDKPHTPTAIAAQEPTITPQIPDYRVIGEALRTYIIIEQGETVLFLDKHAAHERILFEKLKAQPAEFMSQLLLVPITAELTREEATAVLEHAPLLRTFGFEVAEFGESTVVIHQIPAELDETQAEAALQAFAAQLLGGRGVDAADLRDELLHTIACKAAIKAGYHTNEAERDALVRQVMAREDIKYCPHGRPVCIQLTQKALEKQFGRT